MGPGAGITDAVIELGDKEWRNLLCVTLLSHILHRLISYHLQNTCSKMKLLRLLRSDSRATNEASESRVITQVASPRSWPRCQHNFISDQQAGSKDQTGILFPLHLRLRDQLSFTLQKSKPGIQTDYSGERMNHCLTFTRVNWNRRPAGRAHADLPHLSVLHDLCAGWLKFPLLIITGSGRMKILWLSLSFLGTQRTR